MRKKLCTRCEEYKTIDEFYRRSASKDGLTSICKQCKSDVDKERYKRIGKKYYVDNKEKHLKAQKKWRKKNPGYLKTWRVSKDGYMHEWYLNNKEIYSERCRDWYKRNKDKSNAKSASYRVRKFNATVDLSQDELNKVNTVYSVCKYMNSISSDAKCHVDHIIPLSKEGLHHPDNLQILEAGENLSKGNNLYDV